MEDTQDIDAIAMLQDPVRRRLYEYVVAQGREVGRNEAAEATGAPGEPPHRTYVTYEPE